MIELVKSYNFLQKNNTDSAVIQKDYIAMKNFMSILYNTRVLMNFD